MKRIRDGRCPGVHNNEMKSARLKTLSTNTYTGMDSAGADSCKMKRIRKGRCPRVHNNEMKSARLKTLSTNTYTGMDSMGTDACKMALGDDPNVTPAEPQIRKVWMGS